MTKRLNLEAAIDALLAEAAADGPTASLAARRAAMLAEGGRDQARALKAFHLAARLDPADAAPKLAVARLHAEAGDFPAARRVAREVLDSAADDAFRARAAFILGELSRAAGNADAARAAFAEAARIEETVLHDHPDDPAAARWYARAIGRLADLDALTDIGKARTGAEGALALLRAVSVQTGEPPHLAADIADAELRLAAMSLDRKRYGDARARAAQAIGRYEALTVHEPDEPHWRAVLAEAQVVASESAFAAGARDEATSAMNKALALRVRLAAEDPAERGALAALWRLRAALFGALKDHDESAGSLQQAVALAKALHIEAPEDEGVAGFLLHTLNEQEGAARRAGAHDLAQLAADDARALAARFAITPANDAEPPEPLTTEQLDALLLECRAALEAAPRDSDAKRALADILVQIGDAALAERRFTNARGRFLEAFQLRLELAEAAPGKIEPAQGLALALERLGLAAAGGGDIAGARAVWEEELAMVERAYDDVSDAEGQRMRARVEGYLAGLGGRDAAERRASALARLDVLAQYGQLTQRDEELRATLLRH